MQLQKSNNKTSKPDFQQDLKTALIDFNSLKKSNNLPQKMQIKLQYLQNKLLNLPLPIQQLKQLPQYEISSLQQCDQQGKKKLFISIVKCLSGKQLIVYFQSQKIYFKKQQSFTMWHNYFIGCNNQIMWIKKKINDKSMYKEWKIKEIKVSKKCVEYKEKLCFGIMTKEKVKYMIGFKQQSACERVFKQLKQLMKEGEQRNSNIEEKGNDDKVDKNSKNNKSNGMSSKNQNQHKTPTKSEEKLKEIEYSSNNTSRSNINSKQKQHNNNNNINDRRPRKNSQSLLIYQRQIQFQQNQPQSSQTSQIYKLKQREQQQQTLIKQQIKKQPFGIIHDKDYKLIKNFQLGRILLNQKQNKVKIACVLNNIQSDYEYIFQLYLNMKDWNIKIQQCSIINKIGKNSYKLFIKFKKYSIVSLPRWTYLIVTCISIQTKSYLILRSYNELTQQQLLKSSVSSIQIKLFKQTIQLYKKNQNDNRILMTILTEGQFGGYCTKNDDVNMMISIMGGLNDFWNYVQAESIMKHNDSEINKGNRLFEIMKTRKKDGSDSHKNSKNNKVEKSLISSKSDIMGENTQSVISSDKDQQQFEKPIKIGQISNFCNKKGNSYQQGQARPNINSKINESLYKQFLAQFQPYQSITRPSQKLVSFICNKIYQKHYLHHKFQLSSSYIQSSLRHNNIPNDNWLTQKGKWKIDKQQLIFTDQEILAKQKNVIKFILKQISTNVMAGKSIMNMSLPVEIFEEKSFLEKCAEAFGFLPYYFDKAANQKDIIKQIQYISIGMAFSMSICPNIQKPFNPILGETYQCKIGGLNIYFQQICHHPPISAFYIKTQQFQFTGSFNPNIDMGLNTVVAKNQSPFKIKFFKTNTQFIGYSQDFQISGLMFGDRKMRSAGKGFVFEENNQILCELSYGKMKKGVYENKKIRPGEMVGGVYKVTNNFTKRFKAIQKIRQFDGLRSDQKIQELTKFRGSWIGEAFINDVQVKDFQNPVPFKPVKLTYVLPSDCSYRLDCYYKRMNNMQKAQEWKQIMQNLQRKDRKLRQQYNKGGSHH